MDPEAAQAAASGVAAVVGIVYLAIILVMIVSFWVIFKKAGEPGWAILIPIYNLIVYCKIAGKPAWWFILLLIPIVSLIFIILVNIELSKRFGRGAGTAIGLTFLPFVFGPMLAFGSAQYEG